MFDVDINITRCCGTSIATFSEGITIMFLFSNLHRYSSSVDVNIRLRYFFHLHGCLEIKSMELPPLFLKNKNQPRPTTTPTKKLSGAPHATPRFYELVLLLSGILYHFFV